MNVLAACIDQAVRVRGTRRKARIVDLDYCLDRIKIKYRGEAPAWHPAEDIVMIETKDAKGGVR